MSRHPAHVPTAHPNYPDLTNETIRTSEGAHLYLWGETMKIKHSESIFVEGNDFPLHEVTASDDTHAVLLICSERIAADTIDVLSLIRRILAKRKLQPRFVKSGDHVFLQAVSPLDMEIAGRFKGQQAGVIALVNDEEPGHGTHALDEIILHGGDRLELFYRVGEMQPNRSQH